MRCSQPPARVVLQLLLLLLTLTSASCNVNQTGPKQNKKPADKRIENGQKNLAQAAKGGKLKEAEVEKLVELARQERNAEAVLLVLGSFLLQDKDFREKGLHILENVSENLKYEHFLAVLQILDQVLDKQNNSDSVRSHAEDMIQWLAGFLAWMPYFKQHDKENYDKAQAIIRRRLPKPQQA